MEVPKISEYSLLGDCRTGALIGPTGTLAWYCAPRFDSSASFAALLGDHENGAWTLAPNDPTATATSSYVEGTLVLETTFEVVTGSVRVTDFLAIDSPTPTLVRSVECTRGIVAMRSGFAPKMKFGKTTPWTRRRGDAWLVEVAPDGFALRADVELGPTKDGLVATFDARAEERVTFAAQWFEAPGDAPAPIDAAAALAATRDWWTSWAANFRYSGADSAVVLRSALTLKALQHRDSGAFVAAPTTSLPEEIGGTKNWDYRYTWLRDASFTVQSLVSLGFTHEAGRWRDFFASLCAGQPETLHIMYACDGTELAGERTAEKLSGFADSEPVHIANAANTQFQLGVYGDVVRSLDAMNQAGVEIGAEVWRTIEPLAAFVEKKWRMPRNGIWETRNGGRQYVDSKVMAWVALDRLLAIAKRTSLRFDSAKYAAVRDAMHAEICRLGYDPQRKAFTQYYGSSELDASLLLMPLVGFLPADDERFVATVAAIEKELVRDGYVYRYSADFEQSGGENTLPDEGAFIMCGFWLARVYAHQGRHDDAKAMFDRHVAIAGATGLISEEFDVERKIAIGNYPQAFSHAGLIDAAVDLASRTAAVR